MQVARASRKGTKAVLIGHEGHPEVEGTMGQYDNSEGGIFLVENVEDVAQLTLKSDDEITFMTQTTLSIDDTSEVIEALKEKYPSIQGPRKNDICYGDYQSTASCSRISKTI